MRSHPASLIRDRWQPPTQRAVEGPATAPWKGRGKPYLQDRRWVIAWSPEQISRHLVLDFSDDASMRISHEAIYQALYVQSRGALKRELVACLRRGHYELGVHALGEQLRVAAAFDELAQAI